MAEQEQLNFGNNQPCPVCQNFVGDHEHYLLIQEYLNGMKKGKFRVHFDCWKNQYRQATDQLFKNIGEMGQKLVHNVLASMENGEVSPEALGKALQNLKEDKAKLQAIEPDTFINKKELNKKQRKHGFK